MKKTNKKGFTIVELVIVIAIIAILAAVLIPTFSNVIKKANQSSDVQAVRNMNMALAIEQIDNEPETIDDVAAILAEANFNLPRNPLVSGYEFYWISTENVVVLYNTETEKVEFPEEYKDATYDEDTWFSLNWEPVTVVEIHTADELYGYLHDSNITDKAKLVANVCSNDITDEDARHFVVAGVKDLDLNGFTISGKGEKNADEGLDKNAIIYVSTSGNLTIHDDSSTHTGKIEGDTIEYDCYEDDSSAPYAIYNKGTLNVLSGTYIGGVDDDPSEYGINVYLSAVASPEGNEANTVLLGGTFKNQKPTEGGSDQSVDRCTINNGCLFNHKPKNSTYEEGYTLSSEKNADGYYYLIEE